MRAGDNEERPPGGKILFLLQFLIRRIFLSRIQYRFLWPDPIPQDIPPPEGVVFRQVTDENVGQIREWKGPMFERRFRVLLNRDHLGLYALSGGKVVGFLWVAINLGSTFTWLQHDLIESGEAISARSETRQEYRRQGIAFHVHAEMRALIRRVYGEKVKLVWGVTPTDNRKMQDLALTMTCVRSQQQHVVAFLGLLFIYRVWNLVPGTTLRSGSSRIAVRLRIPDLVYTPWLHRLWNRSLRR